MSNKDNFQKPTPYKGKYYIRQYQPDLLRLQLLDQGIDPDTMQPIMPLSPEAKDNVANSKPPAKKSPDTPVVAPSTNNDDDAPATPGDGNPDTPAPTTSRKHKGINLKKVAPLAKKKASPQEMKVRNILNRASSAPGQGRVSDYFFPCTDMLPDLPDLEGDDKPAAVSSPNVSYFCTCTQAPALSPITSSFKVTNNGTIVILDTDTD